VCESFPKGIQIIFEEVNPHYTVRVHEKAYANRSGMPKPRIHLAAKLRICKSAEEGNEGGEKKETRS